MQSNGKPTADAVPEPVSLRPHPTLCGYYGSDADRSTFVGGLFDRGAASYEWVCNVMSFGTGAWYRKQALVEAGLKPGMRVLDVATGTGLVLRSARELSGENGVVFGLDPSGGMLRECRLQNDTPVVQGRGETLPFPSRQFDMVSMGYGLRHVADLHELFAEYHRVLKPGGRVLLLEISQPANAFGRQLNRWLLGGVVPRLTRLFKGAEAAQMMAYFWDTIENCVPPDDILSALRKAGFGDAARIVQGGVLSEYVGTKAAEH